MKSLEISDMTLVELGSGNEEWSSQLTDSQSQGGSRSLYQRENTSANNDSVADLYLWQGEKISDVMLLAWFRDTKDGGDSDLEDMLHKGNLIARYEDSNNFYYFNISHDGSNDAINVEWCKCLNGSYSVVDSGDKFSVPNNGSSYGLWRQIKVRLYSSKDVTYVTVYHSNNGSDYTLLFTASEDEEYDIRQGYSGVGSGMDEFGPRTRGKNYIDNFEVHRISDYSC